VHAHNVARLLRKNARLRWFATGLLTSRVGDAFNGIALAWLALSIGSPKALGLVLLCAGLPRVPLSPVAGHLLDRFDARRLLIIDNVGRALLVMTVPLLGWMHLIHVWQLCVIAAAAGALSTLTDVGEVLVTPALVDDRDLDVANAILSVTYEASAVLGPAAAGLLVELAGYEVAFTCDAMSFAVMAAAACALPRLGSGRSPAGPGGSRTRPRFRDGFTALARLPVIKVLTVVSLGFLLLSGMTEVAWPDLCKYTLHSGAAGFGLLMTVAGVGATAGVLANAGWLARRPARVSLTGVLAVQGLLFVPLVMCKALPAAAVLAFGVYFAGMPFYTLERSLLQREIPAQGRGQVLGARRAFTAGGYPLGAAIAGPLVTWLGAPAVFVVTGAGMVVLASVVLLAPPFRRLAARHQDQSRHAGDLVAVGEQE
jgi:MFS family permease